MTYKEFAMISEENIERMHDTNEQETMYAIIHAAASRGKGKKGKIPEVSDLYKRPSEQDRELTAEDKEEDMRDKYEHTMDWLSQFDFSKFDKEDEEDESK